MNFTQHVYHDSIMQLGCYLHVLQMQEKTGRVRFFGIY